MKKLLFKIARSRVAAYFIGNAFAYLTPLMPLEKLYVDKDVIIFKHPVPFWQTHWLIVPKQRISTFMDLPVAGDSLAIAIFQAVQTVTSRMGLEEFRLLVNGGAYQDVPQLHFHIAAGYSENGALGGKEAAALPKAPADASLYRSARVYPHLDIDHMVHFIIESREEKRPLRALDLTQKEAQACLLDILSLAQQTVTKSKLTQYTLFANMLPFVPEANLKFHLVAGE